MWKDLYESVMYFLRLTTQTELLWTVLPLAITTLIMIFYFEKYRGEFPGWNTYVSNSMVLIFVAMILFRFIYSIDGLGLINFVTHLSKTLVTSFILLLGVSLLFLNFQHFLPEKIAIHVSSPLTLNLIAYIVILYVHAGFSSTYASDLSPIDISNQAVLVLSLFILFLLLLLIFNLIRIPVKKLFESLQKMKEEEKVQELMRDKTEIAKKKKEIKRMEKKVTREKIKELDKQKKEAIKLKKLVNKKT